MDGSADSSPPADWSIIFDLFASEYGYTWEQFISMTYKQLNACLTCIYRRTHNKTAVQARIHGIDMDFWKEDIKPKKEVFDKANDLVDKLLREKQQKTAANG